MKSRLGRPAHHMNQFRETIDVLSLNKIYMAEVMHTWWNKRVGLSESKIGPILGESGVLLVL